MFSQFKKNIHFDIKIVLLKATEIVKKNYLKYILPYRKETPEKFFENLAIDDVEIKRLKRGLTKITKTVPMKPLKT